MSLPPIPNTKLLEDPTSDAIWKRWLNLSFKNVNDLSSASGISFLQAGTGAVARTMQSKARAEVSPDDFQENTTPGTTDMTVGFAAAAATGRNIRLEAGSSYLTGPFTLATAGQVIEAWGATIKLKAASASPLLTCSGVGSGVNGGLWDVNSVAQSGIRLAASYCTAKSATLQNCGAAGIYGDSNSQYLIISENTVKDAVTYGIYVECLTVDSFGNKIIDNVVDTSATAGASGIYLTGDNGFTIFQRGWLVRGNRCNGSVSTPTGVGMTIRGIDGICTENQAAGYTIGLSADITSRSVIANNRTSGALGASGYNIEVGGHHNVISGNFTKDGKYALVMTSAVIDLSHNNINSNTFENPTTNAILISGTGGQTARYNTIAGNNIDMSGGSAGTKGIYLTGDCIHTNITGNNHLGRGSATANTRFLYLDTPPAAAHISVVGNKCSGLERAFGVFSAGALTVTDLTSIGNDLSSDVSQSEAGWAVEGSAVIGTKVTHVGSKNSVGSYKDVHDMLLNVFTIRSTTFNSPEAGLTAGIGSLYISLLTGNTPYIKSTGANTNTGWVTFSSSTSSGFLKCVYTNEDYTVSSNISAITGVDLTLVGTSKLTISGTGRLTIV